MTLDLSQPAGADIDGRQEDAGHGSAVRHHHVRGGAVSYDLAAPLLCHDPQQDSVDGEQQKHGADDQQGRVPCTLCG